MMHLYIVRAVAEFALISEKPLDDLGAAPSEYVETPVTDDIQNSFGVLHYAYLAIPYQLDLPPFAMCLSLQQARTTMGAP